MAAAWSLEAPSEAHLNIMWSYAWKTAMSSGEPVGLSFCSRGRGRMQGTMCQSISGWASTTLVI